jgi:hypothetical protein
MLEELESSSIEDMALVFMVVGRFPCIHAVIDAKKKMHWAFLIYTRFPMGIMNF